jgi:hypothetical protein
VRQLSADRWRTLSPYLDQALYLTGEQRAAWLASIATRDAALAADLESLLVEHQDLQESRFLETAVPQAYRDRARHLLAEAIANGPRVQKARTRS